MENRKIKALLFDLDGLIVDTEPYQFGAFQTLLARRGIELPESKMDELLGFDEITNIHQLRPMYDLKEAPEDLLAERRQIYVDTITRENIEAMEGFWEVTEAARRLGMDQAVVSSSPRQYVEIVLEKLFAGRPYVADYGSYFKAIISGDDVERAKPDPDIYLLAAHRVGHNPAECMALEDSPAGVRAAKAAGIPCVAVVTRYAKPEDFPGAEAVLYSLKDFLPYLQTPPNGD